jgi:hypothetical protein
MPDWSEIVLERVKRLRFGKIELLVHQGRVSQIDITERIRLEDAPILSTRPLDQSQPTLTSATSTAETPSKQ